MERFWSKVAKSDVCWLWIAGKDRDGYGTFNVGNGRMEQAHRVAFKLSGGEIPDGAIVCHSCDTPACVRPEHLFLGTHSANALDRERKLRRSKKVRPRPRVPGSVRWAVMQELINGGLVRPTARKFNISPATVRNIRANIPSRLLAG